MACLDSHEPAPCRQTEAAMGLGVGVSVGVGAGAGVEASNHSPHPCCLLMDPLPTVFLEPAHSRVLGSIYHAVIGVPLETTTLVAGALPLTAVFVWWMSLGLDPRCTHCVFRCGARQLCRCSS